MEEIIKSVTSSLKDVFKDYEAQGIRAIYLWGSVTTEDFDPEISDIDSVAIVNDDFDIELEEIIRQKLQSQYPKIQKFGFRVLYEEELRSGKHIKSPLSSFVPPRLLLFGLHNWLYIGGKQYSQDNFTDSPITCEEAMKLRFYQLKQRNWEDASGVELDEEHHYLKKLWRMMYLLQLMRGIKNKFSYSSIKSNANEEEKEVVEALEAVRQSHYSRDVFLKHISIFNSFVKSIQSKFNI